MEQHCPFSGEACTQNRCKAWQILPGFPDKQCVILIGAFGAVLLANRSLRERRVVIDEDDEE